MAVAAVLLALVSGAAIGVGPARASEQHPTLLELEGEIMCPTCHTTLDQSNSLEAQRIEAFISHRINAGDTKSEIKDKLVAQFGEAILAAPPRRGWDLLVWWLPVAGVAGRCRDARNRCVALEPAARRVKRRRSYGGRTARPGARATP